MSGPGNGPQPDAHEMYTPQARVDPYPVYARLRREAPVHLIRDPNGIEHWLVTRYEDARAALADNRLSRDPQHAWEALRRSGLYPEGGEGSEPHLLNSDPPDHTRMRKLVAKAFTPRRVEAMRPRIQQITDALIDAVAPHGTADLIPALAFPLPITVICELLGVPVEDRADFRVWSTAALTPTYTEGSTMPPHEANRLLREYFTALVTERRRALRAAGDDTETQPDLLSALIVASTEDGRLTEQELISTAGLLLVAGHETTVNLIGNGLLALLKDRRQLELLRSRPELLPQAVEEFLRYDGPVERAMLRVATEDVEIGGVLVPKGAIVTVGVASAHRDPARYPEPDRLDITRADRSHLGFGHGIHFCVGAPVSRMEGQIAVGTVLRRLPDIALDESAGPLCWRPTGVLRGLEALPVCFTPVAPAGR
ncbi:cytochrome P450 family protein [Streptomyces syringium]|uniref:cytochrome P450 family protein n=1 Tax=Streptomyces syringium TaxID=76729 RepID=UPI003453C7B6